MKACRRSLQRVPLTPILQACVRSWQPSPRSIVRVWPWAGCRNTPLTHTTQRGIVGRKSAPTETTQDLCENSSCCVRCLRRLSQSVSQSFRALIPAASTLHCCSSCTTHDAGAFITTTALLLARAAASAKSGDESNYANSNPLTIVCCR